MSRWIIHAQVEFVARHALVQYQGKPEPPHDHRWTIAIRVGTDTLNADGMSLDFHAVRRVLETTVAGLRDSDLNLHPEIGRPTPSAERLAEVTAGWLEPELVALGGRLLSVSVWEGPDNRVDLDLTAATGG